MISEKITYTISVEDIVAWNRHYCYSQKWFRWKMAGGRLLFASWPILMALIANIFIKSYITSVGLLFAGIALSLTCLIIYPSFDEINRKMTIKQYKDEKISPLIGRHQLCIVENGLKCTTDVSEELVYWKGISNIETLQDHTYIYLGRNKAYVIPRSSVAEGNYEKFVNNVSDLWRTNA